MQELPAPTVLANCHSHALLVLLMLQQVEAIIQAAPEAEQILPAAQRAKALLEETITVVGSDYGDALAPLMGAINMVARFNTEQVQRVGGLLTRSLSYLPSIISLVVTIGNRST